MAIPTAPNISTIVSEACMKVEAVVSATIQTRGETYWIEEVKSEIWQAAEQGKLKSLMTENVYRIVDGEGVVSCPTDFSAPINMNLLQCTHYGVCQAGGSTTTAKLAAAEDAVAADIIGHELVVWVTNAAATTKIQAYSGFVTGWNTSTKVATISKAWTPSPDATYSYMVVDSINEITPNLVTDYDVMNELGTGTPLNYAPIGNNQYSEYLLKPVPYRTDSIPWAIKERYYANLLTVDLASQLMANLYLRWKIELVQGVYVKRLQYKDDDRVPREQEIFNSMVQRLISREKFGQDVNNLTAKVET